MKTKTMLALSFVLASFGASAENRVVVLGNGERAAIFDEAGAFTFTAPDNLIGTVQILVVGGGGGGGGGQVVLLENRTLEAGETVSGTVASGGTGGVGAKSGGDGGTTTVSSSASGVSASAVGGGGGAGGWSPTAGRAGACGGGAGGNGAAVKAGGAASVTGGHAGGAIDGNETWKSYGGGGGGWAEAGDDEADGGNGGAGWTSSISGETKMYAYGGGGCVKGKGGADDGYGDGWTSSSSAQPGEDGTGGGGGGGMAGNSSAQGGNGGTGTVIIRYSVNEAQVTVDFTVQNAVGFAPLAVQFMAQVDKPEGANAVLTWDFGDGTSTVETSEMTISHTYAAVGIYTVSVTVVAAGQMVQKTVANCVEVAYRDIWVDAASENPVAPYGTRETAAVSIDDALAAVSTAGQTIRIAPGLYVQPYPAVLDKAVAVAGMGASPRDVVVVQTAPIAYDDDQNKVTRNLFTLDHADAMVCNLTMSNGWHRMVNAAPSAGGVVVRSGGGIVSNCVITGCINARNNHGAAGADLAAGLITHTLVENCEIDNPNLDYTLQSGGASAIRLAGSARAENCLVRNCNKGGKSGEFHAVLLDGANARAVNLTIVSCGSKPYRYQGSDGATTPSFGLYIASGRAINCVAADVYESGDPAVNRAWGGAAANFVNCATDAAAAINSTCVAMTTADFRNFATGDIRPRTGGPLVNAGSATGGFTAGSTDYAGNPRIVGRAVDIGCCECQSFGLSILIR